MYSVYGLRHDATLNCDRTFQTEPCETREQAERIAARMQRELGCKTQIAYCGRNELDALAYERVKNHERDSR